MGPRNPWDHAHQAESMRADTLFQIKAGEVADAETEQFFRDADTYLSIFAKPIVGENGEPCCLHCGQRVFHTWSLAHGEAHCSNCGWPSRVYHDAKGENGTVIFSGAYPLQYMPDEQAEAQERAALANLPARARLVGVG